MALMPVCTLPTLASETARKLICHSERKRRRNYVYLYIMYSNTKAAFNQRRLTRASALAAGSGARMLTPGGATADGRSLFMLRLNRFSLGLSGSGESMVATDPEPY